MHQSFEGTALKQRALDLVLAGVKQPGAPAGNSPGTKWVTFNAIAEHLDHGRRYTKRIYPVRRSFEEAVVKHRALDLVLAA